ncbi:PVC-type heme-binding CxxCH protein [Aquirufa sp.]|jgi:putative membrane-bound dehydrogenase-like protein|uniref:PVC-type heme-binding CxxCH protein n=1 Tax=Aquirufa sp. TaxID=2676249 RepID=UPI0037BF7165
MKKTFLGRLSILGSICLVGYLGISSFQKNEHQRWGQALLDSLTESQKHEAVHALEGLQIDPDLQITTFATEPMVKNPTNMDIDSKGRVWITEAFNYRPAIAGNPTNPAGDRIIILEDSNGDGKADKEKVFYQSPELNAPLGIAVLDSMVIVAQSPYIWKLYDDNHDDKADRKEIMFQGIGGEQHDHGAHAFTFGPDGKLYFNLGNEGKQLLDAQGKPVLDQDGDIIGPNKYKQGMVFRCNLDGSNVECLGQNFRNNFEVAVDSYGALWQSDNDDDGNKGVRINAVFEHGNYGYTDEMTGESWYVKRTNMETEIPLQHWHLNDPGVVPNLLQTGSGSPTGILVYEGQLLPAKFQNHIIHADAGPNVVRAYPTKTQGAGYSASIINLVEGVKDQWFRPADVTVAPDGSIFIADWYDPGVGGHQAGDQNKGRIYRIAPKNTPYLIKKLHLDSPIGAITALFNPNLATRYLGYKALQGFGKKAHKDLADIYESESNPRLKARLFWILAQGPDGLAYIDKALKQSSPEWRMMGIRAAKVRPFDSWKSLAHRTVNDSDFQVKRELAIALHHLKNTEADDIWAQLASQHTGTDRWYLEALGIGADRLWDSRLSAYLALKPADSPAFRDLIFRARTPLANQYVFQFLKEGKSLAEKLRYFRTLDFLPGEEKSALLVQLINDQLKSDAEASLVAIRHISPDYIQNNVVARKTVIKLLPKNDVDEYTKLIEKYSLTEMKPDLMKIILSNKGGRQAAKAIYSLEGGSEFIKKSFAQGNTATKRSIIEAIRWVGNKETVALLNQTLLNTKLDLIVRKDAAKGIGNSYPAGEDFVLQALKQKQIPETLIPSVVESVSRAWRKGVRLEANTYLTGVQSANKTKHPALNELVNLKGVAQNGIKVFVEQCAMCHQINNEGIDFGPKLSEIGSKLSKEGMYLSILHPNAGIGFGYETFEITTKKGDVYQGVVTSKNETDIILKLPGGSTQNFKTSALKSVKQLDNSMMPDGLADGMSTTELTDLVTYLSTLKKK